MRLRLADVSLLACVACRGPLQFRGDLVNDDELERGALVCRQCGRSWAVVDGLARFVDRRAVQGTERLLRLIYDAIAPVHDLGVELALPIMHFPDDRASHDLYLDRLDLEELEPRADGAPLRILEVGIGGGRMVPLIEDRLPTDLPVELWGLDFSRGMMRECRRRLARGTRRRRVRLLLADAHALPFPAGAFDRVFHVGGLNGYRDRALALAEMARVARPGTPIVVVDEQLDPARAHSLYHRLMFWSITWYDADPTAPTKYLPPGASDVEVVQVSRFYYCLRFRIPPAKDAAAAPRAGMDAAAAARRAVLSVTRVGATPGPVFRRVDDDGE